MAISDAIKNNIAWKDVKRKAYTSQNAKYYEENRNRNRFLPAQFVIGEDIPYPPPAGDTDVVKYWDIPLVLDNGVPNRRTWFAHAPNQWQSGWDSSQDQSNVGMGFVDPSIGGALYVAKLFRGSTRGGDRVPEAHTSDWMFDYDTGVLTFNSETPPELGTSAEDSPRLQVWKYEGKSILEVVSQASGRLVVKGDLIGDTDGINKNFALPASVDMSSFYEVRVSGVPLEANDFVVFNGTSVSMVAAPMGYQKPDIVYYIE